MIRSLVKGELNISFMFFFFQFVCVCVLRQDVTVLPWLVWN